MTARRPTSSRPGYGDSVTLTSSTSGKQWTGLVLVWGGNGEPYVSDDVDASRRWYPASWVTDLIPGDGPGPCSCPPASTDPEVETPTAAECDQHGDPATLLRKARA